MLYIAQFFQVWGSMISTVALLATLLVIIWYTSETRKLRIATESQTDSILSPSIIVEPRIETSGIKCKNVGNSPALNVTIEPVEVRHQKGDLLCKIKFKTKYLLESGKDFVPRMEFEFNNKYEYIKSFIITFDNIFQFPFFSKKLLKELEMTDYSHIVVHYKNLKNTQFVATAKVKHDEKKIEILDIRKV